MISNLPVKKVRGYDVHVVDYHGRELYRRVGDCYFDASSACKMHGKLFANYYQLASTSVYLDELSRSIGIPIDQLVIIVDDGPNEFRGTWVHPLVMPHFGQWLNARFAVFVSIHIINLLTHGYTELAQRPQAMQPVSNAQQLVILKGLVGLVDNHEIELARQRKDIDAVIGRMQALEGLVLAAPAVNPSKSSSQTASDLDLRLRCERRLRWYAHHHGSKSDLLLDKAISDLDTQERINIFKRYKNELNRAKTQNRPPEWAEKMDLVVRLGLVDKLWGIIDNKYPNNIGPVSIRGVRAAIDPDFFTAHE